MIGMHYDSSMLLPPEMANEYGISHTTNQNQQEYQDQLKYLETLNKEQYKWTVQGLKAAGLNPILAANGGAHSATTAANIGNYNNNSKTAMDTVTSILQTMISYFMLKKLK